MHDLKKGKELDAIACDRGLSRRMVDYRVRVTGITRQLAASGYRRF